MCCGSVRFCRHDCQSGLTPSVRNSRRPVNGVSVLQPPDVRSPTFSGGSLGPPGRGVRVISRPKRARATLSLSVAPWTAAHSHSRSKVGYFQRHCWNTSLVRRSFMLAAL
jgi:hypothetical protein